MTLLIDGYNLLNVAGVDSRRTVGRTQLERSRIALLKFLERFLTAEERATTTIVFDAAQAPPGLPDKHEHAGMQVRFARNYPAADDLIEELIAADRAPRGLVVVSSDHRLHRAARRRRATAIDSDVWVSELEHRAKTPPISEVPPQPDERFVGPLGESWLAEFLAEFTLDPADDQAETWNPFPPGYGEDVAGGER
jgi:predicted RNA-binding protein with PIN domain